MRTERRRSARRRPGGFLLGFVRRSAGAGRRVVSSKTRGRCKIAAEQNGRLACGAARTDTIMAEQDDISDAIAEFNRSYLMLAKWMILTNRDEAMRQLGITEKTASAIAALTLAQIDELADRGELFCEFRAGAAPGRA
ncbi:flagellar transcriptional regulator FlhD [Burkholderia pseudomultivorans]|uniref:flagellar transcriptional regulator FlhD n=1 Tax=Burkholderia pseudomultivorans TaxID=1207504 RepID=UPI001E40315E|nr:flagellar transcriptional regulator FlhD [Burkholderia pseudomultivorans]